MSSWVFLNHKISSETPLYGDAGNIRITNVRQISKGDTSNNSEIQMPLHSGTHIDAPFHFDAIGKKVSDYSAEFWVFNNIFYIELIVEVGQIITLPLLEQKLIEIPQKTEFLIIKTNFEKNRQIDRETYIKHNPGFSPEVGIWLRKNLAIRALGFDFISLTSYQNRQLGRISHRAFLSSVPDGQGNFPFAPVLIVEDMKLSEISKAPEQVIIAPLLVENADGVPVTIFAKV